MAKFLTVILPCYNEEANLKKGVLKEVYDYLQTKAFAWEVLISDDGSSDNSKKLVKEYIKNWEDFKLLENPHGGKPSALLYGIKKAQGDYVLFTDMDQSTPIEELDKLLPFMTGEYGAVIGSRGIKRKDFPIYRQLGSFVFATIRRSLILPELSDTQCGFKAFKTSVVAKAFPKLEFFKNQEKVTGWKVTSYDVELLHIIKHMGEKIKEVVVVWHDRDVSSSKGGGLSKYVKESKEMFVQILRVKLNDLKHLYD